MGIVVQKYGGTSVANVHRLRDVAQRVIAAKKKVGRIVVVVSAQGDMTDQLLAKAYQISKSPPERELDMLLATGEQISSALLAMAIAAEGHPVISLTGAQVGISTSGLHTRAKIRGVDRRRLLRELENDQIVVVAGFQGVNDLGDITTLGRGGSDTTAVALASALEAEVCEIYTDVDGVYTADPRLVSNARKLPAISYAEMLELASLGAVVLQPRAVELAAAWGVRLHVRSAFNFEPGTIVWEEEEMEKKRVVSGVTHDTNVAKVVVVDVEDRPGIAHKIFSALARDGINVDMIVQTTKRGKTTDLLFSICKDDLSRTEEIMDRVYRELGAKGVLYDDSLAKVSIVGAGMMSNPGVAAAMFEVLAENDINIDVISTSEIKVSCLIAASKVDAAVQAIHNRFDLGDKVEANE